MAEQPEGCARVTGTVSGGAAPEATAVEPTTQTHEEERMTARVGHQAPDFVAPAYVQGGFETVKLSDHFGGWLLLCFYPGDFTFV